MLSSYQEYPYQKLDLEMAIEFDKTIIILKKNILDLFKK